MKHKELSSNVPTWKETNTVSKIFQKFRYQILLDEVFSLQAVEGSASMKSNTMLPCLLWRNTRWTNQKPVVSAWLKTGRQESISRTRQAVHNVVCDNNQVTGYRLVRKVKLTSQALTARLTSLASRWWPDKHLPHPDNRTPMTARLSELTPTLDSFFTDSPVRDPPVVFFSRHDKTN